LRVITPQERSDALLLWEYHRLGHELRPCDAAVGLGSHDIGVATYAAELYHRGLYPVVVLTGGSTPTTRERFPRGEAVHYREHALALGVPDTAIDHAGYGAVPGGARVEKLPPLFPKP
jgi:hypothetical protein